MINRILISGHKTFQILIACLCLFGLFWFLAISFGDCAVKLVSMNPFVNGFFHSGLKHLSYNIFTIFIFLIPTVNDHYDFKKIYWLSFFISLLYFPFVILGISPPAIGISGVCFYLMTRYMLSDMNNKALNIIYPLLYLIIIYPEINQIGSDDTVAHGVHLIGSAFGYISLKYDDIKSIMS